MAKVQVVEKTGHENIVFLELPGGQRLTARTGLANMEGWRDR
jgi:hypothetical protein